MNFLAFCFAVGAVSIQFGWWYVADNRLELQIGLLLIALICILKAEINELKEEVYGKPQRKHNH